MFNSVGCYSKAIMKKTIEISRVPRGGHITYRCKIWSDLFLRNQSYRLLKLLVSSNDLYLECMHGNARVFWALRRKIFQVLTSKGQPCRNFLATNAHLLWGKSVWVPQSPKWGRMVGMNSFANLWRRMSIPYSKRALVLLVQIIDPSLWPVTLWNY